MASDDPVEQRQFRDVTTRIARQFELHGKALDVHQKRLDAVLRDLNEIKRSKELAVYKEAVRAHLGESQRYTNVVLGVGYAGYFALWALVKGDLSAVVHALAGLCMAISLSVFVGWEVYRMANFAFESQEIERLLQQHFESQPGLAADVNPDDIRALMELYAARQNRLWPMVLAFTVLPAVFGAVLLFHALAGKLISSIGS